MRVLLAAKHAPGHSIGGVQSWCLTVAAELRRLGHEVETWGPALPLPSGRFDAGIFANVADTGKALPLCDKVLNVSHGIIPAEQPAEGLPHAFTSEGVKRHWGGSGPIIRQPIDTAFWTPGEARRYRLLRYSYRAGLPFVLDIARDMGLYYTHLRNASHEDARRVMRESVCVLATGRAALEAMACGVPVLICDHRSAYQGPLVSYSPATQMLENYSGRGGVEATREAVERGIEDAIRAGSQRLHVESHHDARKIAEELLCLAS
jgi:hypothetical protein